MRIAFYAPLKPPHHANPSGDRYLARLLIRAMEEAGHEVELAASLRSRDSGGDVLRQKRLDRIGRKLAERYVRRLENRPDSERPDLWFTYHLYYKAVDWIGPHVCRALEIPYVVAEASVAHKRVGGPWDYSHWALLDALNLVEGVVTLNPHDAGCIPDHVPSWHLPPFIPSGLFSGAADQVMENRKTITGRYNLRSDRPIMACVAMMRPGDKLESYRALSAALRGMPDLQWQLLVIGDGQARSDVEEAFRWAGQDKVVFTGRLEQAELAQTLSACDLYVWPAIREAFGMAFLEAQAAGLPVVAGNAGGVSSVVADNATGILTTEGDVAGFASAVRLLLTTPAKRRGYAEAARQRIASHHDLTVGAQRLDAILTAARRNYVAPGLPLFDFAHSPTRNRPDE
ncbi:glycosyltransferase family 4 protein [Kiloniella sp. b19]|uniref:glycosyltransferase family 4 protein n=1 Tax=Kiloniella sp. GXU_MW_B19 TaxID=3141326 RepID=UPI0031D0E251